MADLRDAGPARLNLLTATEATPRMASGEITSEQLVTDCLARIEARDGEIAAWAFVDPALALGQARAMDAERAERGARGPLHGVPVGIKDIFDTHDMPTEYGSPIHKGFRPAVDTACVEALRRAGAVILGKTRTTEFASPVPCGVRNPHDYGRSPGVSSSGSAAAVADFMVPLAVGSQTGGSVILPAAFCGCVGYKASLSGLDRGGIRQLRPGLDTLGLLGRSVGDIAAAREALTSVKCKEDSLPTAPKVGVCRTDCWDQAQPETVDALQATANALRAAGATLHDVDWPDSFADIETTFGVISSVEGLRALDAEHRDHAAQLNDWIRDGAEAARAVTPDAFAAASAHAVRCRADLARLFEQVDFLITPGTPGEASTDLTGISNSCFNRIWTLMHVPCVTLPAFTGPNGAPVGVQLIGPLGGDDRLLAAASWVWERLG